MQVLHDVSKITGNMRAGIDVRSGLRSANILDHTLRKPHSSASFEACARVAPGPFVRDVPTKRRRQVVRIASDNISITIDAVTYVRLSHGSAPLQKCLQARLCKARHLMHAGDFALQKSAALSMAL